MNHQNQLEQMANGAMFATISLFFVIYDNTSKASINLQKLTKLEPLTLAWMLTIIQTPPRSNFPLFDPKFTFSPFGLIPLKPLACLNHELALVSHSPPLELNLQKVQSKMGPGKLASPSKHGSRRKVKYKGERRMNHDPYV
jgi:hypothetical protein